MKAIHCYKYSHPKDLQIVDAEKPRPKEDEVLVRIRATAINDFDWSLVTGKPFLYRLLFGILKPKTKIPGIELSGTIEEIGNQVLSLKVGDDVYGDISDIGWGTFAEYICVKESTLISKPTNMTFDEAVSIPHASMLAYQSLVDLGNIKDGQNILINGAGGGVGTIGLQISKLYNATVTGVDTGDKLSKMMALGFDSVIDYKKEDFTAGNHKYDLILDAKTNRHPSAYQKVLKPEGVYVTVGGELKRLMQVFIKSKMGKKNLHVLGLKPNKGLEFMNELIEQGKIKAVIDGPYQFEEIPRLIQYFGEGKHYGKVVVSIS